MCGLNQNRYMYIERLQISISHSIERLYIMAPWSDHPRTTRLCRFDQLISWYMFFYVWNIEYWDGTTPSPFRCMNKVSFEWAVYWEAGLISDAYSDCVYSKRCFFKFIQRFDYGPRLRGPGYSICCSCISRLIRMWMSFLSWEYNVFYRFDLKRIGSELKLVDTEDRVRVLIRSAAWTTRSRRRPEYSPAGDGAQAVGKSLQLEVQSVFFSQRPFFWT